jgi:hypothetical protein
MITIENNDPNLGQVEKARQIFDAGGGSLWNFWTTAKDESGWWELVQEGGRLGFVFLFHKGVKNLSLCMGSEVVLGELFLDTEYGDSGIQQIKMEEPLLFCPSQENIDVHISVDPDLYFHMLKFEIDNIKKYKKSLKWYERTDCPRREGGIRKFDLQTVERWTKGDPLCPIIYNIRIMSDNRYLGQGPLLTYIESFWHTRFREAIDRVDDLRAKHPESIFDIHLFGHNNQFIGCCYYGD